MSRLRGLALPIGVVATVLLAYLVNPWVTPGAEIRGFVTLAFWVAAIVLAIALFEDRKSPAAQEAEVEGPAFARFLFSNTRAGLLWLPIRLFVGFSFLEAGLHKFTDPGWTQGGASLLAYWQRAVAIPEAPARPAITYEWYRGFIQLLIDNGAQGWFAWVITLGELAVGVGLIFGILTGLAAFGGALMNMSFLLAGSASTNPVLFTLGVGIILAWKVAGYYGVDRYLLPMLGTPWRPGTIIHHTNAPAPTTS